MCTDNIRLIRHPIFPAACHKGLGRPLVGCGKIRVLLPCQTLEMNRTAAKTKGGCAVTYTRNEPVARSGNSFSTHQRVAHGPQKRPRLSVLLFLHNNSQRETGDRRVRARGEECCCCFSSPTVSGRPFKAMRAMPSNPTAGARDIHLAVLYRSQGSGVPAYWRARSCVVVSDR